MKMNAKFKLMMAVLLTAMLLVIAACGGAAKDNNNGNAPGAGNGGAAVEQGEAAPASEYPLKIKDDTGTELTFEQAPSKVVTLVPSETEIMYALGGADLVAGVDAYSNYPEEAAAKPKVGDMTTNIEAVVALTPDLVLASSSMNTAAVEKLRELGIPVFASDPLTYDATIEKIEKVGHIVNKNEEAAEVASHMRETKQQVVNAVKDAQKKTVYLEFSVGWTVGSGTFLDELVSLAGGTNIAAATPSWHEVNAEEVVKQNPQIIIFPALKEEPNPIKAAIESRPGWDTIDALKNKQLFTVTEDPLVRVGPRLADGLLELAKAIHPDLVK
ncbi:ABC transporter substrate-binding protein [Paenibacillus radicis (ex Gao et al. 2016)]|uniref:ABC transporter substrate-binding protein n=1 Tax=Paenibacillus radicis (ex Gao et al. 2016) TaxID=1737354 RepID=A0A917HIS9_9BACL|nr:ABC transporter substrate-binding protein [Paenibacillus radicis (ex Gao et al. 2016)]GGG79987.1 ABC transporter substrate-binding protein [Paenibacillus radicis (ex Gao et al. 2016)]